ncbi:MAG: hypothetical protein DMC60_08665, partial [Verrucomicrobia bacterium]
SRFVFAAHGQIGVGIWNQRGGTRQRDPNGGQGIARLSGAKLRRAEKRSSCPKQIFQFYLQHRFSLFIISQRAKGGRDPQVVNELGDCRQATFLKIFLLRLLRIRGWLFNRLEFLRLRFGVMMVRDGRGRWWRCWF